MPAMVLHEGSRHPTGEKAGWACRQRCCMRAAGTPQVRHQDGHAEASFGFSLLLALSRALASALLSRGAGAEGLKPAASADPGPKQELACPCRYSKLLEQAASTLCCSRWNSSTGFYGVRAAHLQHQEALIDFDVGVALPLVDADNAAHAHRQPAGAKGREQGDVVHWLLSAKPSRQVATVASGDA